MTQNYGPETEAKIAQVVDACRRYGDRAIIALAGVPGTGKSFVASIAAQRFTDEPTRVRDIQFHQSFTYEEFVEGLRIDESGVRPVPGIFSEWNERALDDEQNKYVLLIEELSRANIPAVLGELMTYLEYRDRPFVTIYSRKPVTIAKNLTLLATFNPTDRSALEVDAALVRRLRIIRFPPSAGQLEEMLKGKLEAPAIRRLQELFQQCQIEFGDDFETAMPFGHGIFAGVEVEADLHPLWNERIVFLLRRPLLEPHPFTGTIEDAYPWRNAAFRAT